MRMRKALLLVFGFGSAVATTSVAFGSDTCNAEIPAHIKRAISTAHKGWRPVAMDDLSADNRALWTKVHGARCPSVVVGEFLPKSERAVAVLLVKEDKGARNVRVVVGRDRPDGKSALQTVYRETVTNFPVIHKANPGTYRSSDGTRSKRVATSVLIYEHLETRTMAFYYANGGFKRLVLSE